MPKMTGDKNKAIFSFYNYLLSNLVANENQFHVDAERGVRVDGGFTVSAVSCQMRAVLSLLLVLPFKKSVFYQMKIKLRFKNILNHVLLLRIMPIKCKDKHMQPTSCQLLRSKGSPYV